MKMRFSASKITVARCLQSILFQNITHKAQCAPSGVGAISPFQEECRPANFLKTPRIQCKNESEVILGITDHGKCMESNGGRKTPETGYGRQNPRILTSCT